MNKVFVVTVVDRSDSDRCFVRRAFGSRYSANEWAAGWIERGDRAKNSDDPDYGFDAEVHEVDFYP